MNNMTYDQEIELAAHPENFEKDCQCEGDCTDCSEEDCKCSHHEWTKLDYDEDEGYEVFE